MTAVTANVDGRALFVLGHVALAAFLGKTLVVHVLERGERMTSVATIRIGIAIQEDLGSQVVRGPRSFRHQTHAVGNGGGRGKCPARTTVLRNVLVLRDGHVVDPVDVTTRTMSKLRNRERIVILRKLRSLQVGGGNGRLDEFRERGRWDCSSQQTPLKTELQITRQRSELPRQKRVVFMAYKGISVSPEARVRSTRMDPKYNCCSVCSLFDDHLPFSICDFISCF